MFPSKEWECIKQITKMVRGHMISENLPSGRFFSTLDTNARLQYKTDMVDDKHPLCKIMKRHFRGSGLHSKGLFRNWDFKSHFDCDDNRIVCIYGSKRFLVFDMYDHPNELDILEYTKNMFIDILALLEKRK